MESDVYFKIKVLRRASLEALITKPRLQVL